jgi:hypothetical protein
MKRDKVIRWCIDNIHRYGGKLVGGSAIYDGVHYQFKSIWSDDDNADEFISSIPDGTKTTINNVISDRCIANDTKKLTMFFSIIGD